MKILAKEHDVFHNYAYQYGIDEKIVLNLMQKPADFRGNKEQIFSPAMIAYGTNKWNQSTYLFFNNEIFTIKGNEGLYIQETTGYRLIGYRSYSVISKDTAPQWLCEYAKKIQTPIFYFRLTDKELDISKPWEYSIGLTVQDHIPFSKLEGFYTVYSAENVYRFVYNFLIECSKDKDIPTTIPDAIKIQQHGFDTKWSFKKRK